MIDIINIVFTILWSIFTLVLLIFVTQYIVSHMVPKDKIENNRKLDEMERKRHEKPNMKSTPEWTCSTYSSEQRKRLFK